MINVGFFRNVLITLREDCRFRPLTKKNEIFVRNRLKDLDSGKQLVKKEMDKILELFNKNLKEEYNYGKSNLS